MYRIIYEYASRRSGEACPRYFDPSQPKYAYANDLRAALKNVRAVVGKTRQADLSRETDQRVVERRRNKQYIVTIIES